MSVITIENLKKYYGKNRGIEDITLSVNEGDIYGFIGPNGAGKSTTIRLLMNFIYPTSGSMRVFDKDVSVKGEIIRADMGYLPSEVYYYESVKVKELLHYSAKLKNVKDLNWMNHLIELFELDVNRKFGQLSYGNKKKVGIIQSMMHHPKLLVLDEPTNGLDPLVQKTLLELLREENKNGTTIFFSSHTLSVVQKMCTKIGIIKEGKMLENGAFDGIKNKKLKKISIESDEIIPKGIFDSKAFENLIIDKQSASFYYNGDINDLFKRCENLPINDFNMHEPELEEVFMHFYEKEDVK